MSAEIVNLRRVRKAKLRAEKSAEAAANRVSHGVSKVARDVDKAERERTARDLDGHRLQGANDDDGDAP